MSKNVNKTSMQELCEITSSKRVYAADYQSEGVPFYRGKEIIEKHKGNLDVSTELFISENKFEEFKKKFGVPQPGDLLLTSVGTLGVPYVVKPGEVFYFKDGNLTWFSQFRNLDSHFLYYWLLSPQGKAELKKCTIGSSQSAFTIVLLKDMEIELPPLSTQQKIASILSAYDDLIENNNRRIKILEEMAQAIYKEWFVNFRFPGHEKVKMIKSKLGMIPEGWEVKILGEVIELAYGKALKAEDRLPGTVPVYGSAGVVGSHKESLVKGPGIIVGRKGNVGSIHWSDEDFYPIDTVFYVKTDICLHYVYYNLLYQNFINTDAAVPGLNRNQAYRNSVLIPNERLLDAFRNYVDPLFRQKCNLTFKNEPLRRTRDLLLPKLISGEIDVERLDISIAESA